MEITVTNLMDAFKALEDVEEDDSKVLTALKEGRSFDIRSTQEMEEAEEYIKPVKKEVKLEVIDPDADSVEHLKDNEDYIGQMILQCAVCKSKIFVDADKLTPSEGDEDIYNTDIECPHCHKEGRGYTLLGQVGKVTQEEEEVSVDNDSLTSQEDEVRFDKIEDEPEAEEPAQPEAEEPAAADEEDFIEDEKDGMQTELLDDTEDLETGKLGDEVEEVIKYDDTEEAPEPEEPDQEDEEDKEEETSTDDEIKAVEDEEDEDKKKNESLVEDVEIPTPHVRDLFDRFLEPSNIKIITIWELGDSTEEKIYEGSFEDMPESFNDLEMKSFNVDGGKLVINTDLSSEAIEGNTVTDFLRLFDDEFDSDIMIEDAEQGELISSTKGSILDVYDELPLIYVNAPERINIYCEKADIPEALKTPMTEDLDMADPEDRLIADIFRRDGYKENRIKIPGTPEFWIARSIRDKEDLDIVYREYVRPCPYDVKKAFKEITGYQDPLDESTLEEKDSASTPVDMDTSIEKAKELLKSSDAYAVIYGYQKNGKFFGFKDPIICKDAATYDDKVEIVNLRYRPTGSISTLFHRVVEESIDVDSRKALVKLIDECRNNKQPYTIKSRGNGRYTLLRESPAPLVPVADEVESEVVDQVPTTEVETSTAVMDPRDQEMVDKLMRISRDTAQAIRDNYHVEVDERAILADMIQDLQLISGQLRPEDIADTPMNQLTKQMYQAYEGFYDALDSFTSFITGRPLRTTQAQKLTQALGMLDSEAFSQPAIARRIASPEFQIAMRRGSVPGILTNGRADVRPVGEEVEDAFSEEDFEKYINEYLDDEVDDTCVFCCDNSRVDENKEVVVKGHLLLEDDKEDNITFILTPILDESIDGGSAYKVTNSLTEKELTYKTHKGE